MRDVRSYWKEIHALQATLPDFLRVTSGEGAVIEVSAAVAAKLLHAKSHRLATEEEIRARAADEDARNRETAEEELRRRGIAVVTVKHARSRRLITVREAKKEEERSHVENV